MNGFIRSLVGAVMVHGNVSLAHIRPCSTKHHLNTTANLNPAADQVCPSTDDVSFRIMHLQDSTKNMTGALGLVHSADLQPQVQHDECDRATLLNQHESRSKWTISNTVLNPLRPQRIWSVFTYNKMVGEWRNKSISVQAFLHSFCTDTAQWLALGVLVWRLDKLDELAMDNQ